MALKCPRCEVEMVYDPKFEFWKCPECGGEFWEDQEKLVDLRAEKERYEYLLRWGISKPAAPVLPPVAVWVRKGKKGNRKAGRRVPARKKYKPLVTERYLL